MVEALGDEFDFRIVCSDRDFLGSAPYPGITVNQWTPVGKASVFYASPRTHSIARWRDLMREQRPDVIYLNSLFNPGFTLKPLFARRLLGSQTPVALAPRGELSPAALAIKAWKKVPFLMLAKAEGLYRGILWHASTEEEAAFIRTQFRGHQHIGVAQNIVIARDLHSTIPEPAESPEVRSPELRVAFLSRIAQMKNLDFALKVLVRCETPLRFDIWGSIEDAPYWHACKELIAAMPGNVRVRYRGVAEPTEVTDILSSYDLFFLPTRGENYGHVIAEALCAGTPVLISDKTVWRGLAEQGAGWDLPLSDQASFVAAIDASGRKTSEERREWRRRVHQYAKAHIVQPASIEANRQVFLRAMSGSGRRPQEVSIAENVGHGG
jgi:glycosyltransferase involved in cell wall biosynthesis